MSVFKTEIVKSFPKGAIILKQGAVCNFGCRVITGCLKSYFIDKSDKEHIIQFAPENWIITDMESLYNKTPSNIVIEAVEDTHVHWIQSEKMMEVWKNFDKEELINQIELLTRNIITANKRTRMLLSSTAKERYLDFLQTYPTLIQRISLKQIALYLGITPEYLSEIRRTITGK